MASTPATTPPSDASKASPLVSIVIVTHNREAMANRAIKSVYDQDYRPIELVIIDNQSTAPFTPPSPPDGVAITVLRTPYFMNTAQSRNLGVATTTGALVGMLDDDDYFLPGKINKQAQVLRDNDDVQFAYINTERLGKNGVSLSTMRGLYTQPLVRFIHLNGLLLRREVALAEPFDERMTRHVDDHLAFRLYLKYQWRHLDEPGAVWNHDDRPDQLTHHSVWTRFRGFPEKYRNWKILCEDFADQHDQSTHLRSHYYGRQAKLSLIMGKPREAFAYHQASIGRRPGPRPSSD